MGYDLPHNWYADNDGQGLVLDPEIVATEIERLRAALGSAASWIERWAGHVGKCEGGSACTCGRSAVLYDARTTLDNEQLSDGERNG